MMISNQLFVIKPMELILYQIHKKYLIIMYDEQLLKELAIKKLRHIFQAWVTFSKRPKTYFAYMFIENNINYFNRKKPINSY